MLVELKTFYNEMEAQIILTFLKDRDIESFIDKDDAGGMHPHLQSTTGVKVLVRKEDLDIAKKLIEDDSNTNKTSWTCVKCNEVHDPQFLVCWNCGESRLK